MAKTGKEVELAELDSMIAEYRATVVNAAYSRLIRLLTDSCLTEDLETACKIGHMLKEMGLV